MTSHISVYPNPFTTSISLEVVVDKNESTIVRIINEAQKIIRLMSWNLKKGTNKTAINDLDSIPPGTYFVDIVALDGKSKFNTSMIKEL